jgi:hypothetical protein
MRAQRVCCLIAAMFPLILVCSPAVLGQSNDKDQPKLKQPTAKQLKIAEAIANGHSYEKHVVKEKLFPEVKDREDFAKLIGKVIANAAHHKELENDREAFYDQKTNTIVIVNPRARDKGTCFRPDRGKKYFDNLK